MTSHNARPCASIIEAISAFESIISLLEKQSAVLAFTTNPELANAVPQETREELVGVADQLTQRAITTAETAMEALGE